MTCLAVDLSAATAEAKAERDAALSLELELRRLREAVATIEYGRDTALEQLAALRAAFARFAGHAPTCDREQRQATTCPCGFTEVRATCGGLEEPTETPEREDGRGIRTAPPGPYRPSHASEAMPLPCYCAETHLHNCPRHHHLQDVPNG
jgi:hypothetical protein